MNPRLKKLILLNAGIGLAYLVSSLLAVRLALPPGNASPIWPGAGIALAAYILYGKRILPGLFVGILGGQINSMAASFSVEEVVPALLSGILFTFGSVLQVLTGGHLVKRFVRHPKNLLDDADIARFLLLGGPVSCVIASTVGNAVLWSQGGVLAEDWLLSWAVWWLGDTMGVLIFAPLTMALIGKPANVWHGRRHILLFPLLTLLGLSILIFYHTRYREQKNMLDDFERQALLLHRAFIAEMEAQYRLTAWIQSFYARHEKMTSDELAWFVWPIRSQLGKISTLEWLVAQCESGGFSGDGNWGCENRFKVAYRQPPDACEDEVSGVGDSARLPGFSSLLKRVGERGEITLTEIGHGFPGGCRQGEAVFYAPVYRFRSSGEAGEKKVLRGVIANVLALEGVLASARSRVPGSQLTVRITDGALQWFAENPWNHAETTDIYRSSWQKVYPLEIAGANWRIYYHPTAKFSLAYQSWNTWWILFGGVLFTSLVTMGLLMLTGRNLRTELLVRSRTRELERSNLKLAAREAEFRQLVQAQSAIIWRAEPHLFRYTFVSDEAEKVLGYPIDDWLNNPRFWLDCLHPDDRAWVLDCRRWETARRQPYTLEYRVLTRRGEILWLKEVGNIVTENGQVKELVGFMLNVTDKKRQEEEIHTLAFYDPLTGLANRRLILERLRDEIRQASREKKFGALLFMDLDRFKMINDSMGHHAGDNLLVQVADRIRQVLRGTDTPARQGGDEFVVLLHPGDHDLHQARKHAGIVAEKIKQALSRPFHIGGRKLHCLASIGIALYPNGEAEALTILQHADRAMYQAKAKGKNTICFYHPMMQQASQARLDLEQEMRSALKSRHFVLYYQPQICWRQNTVSVEALLRWQHPDKGLIFPNDFISVAEDSGLMIPLGEWVIEQACRKIAEWHGQGLAISHIAVNVSSKQFHQSGFVDYVESLLVQYSLNPSWLMLELTESVMAEHLSETVAIMRALTRLGVRISIDDFGTGYSSLAYLKQFPVQQLKIDRSFVKDICRDSNDAAIVEAIIAMAQKLEIDVVAEGVEDEEQLTYLKERGCQIFQGFYFSRPLSEQALPSFVGGMDEPSRSLEG